MGAVKSLQGDCCSKRSDKHDDEILRTATLRDKTKRPSWDRERPTSFGVNKIVYAGTFNGSKVAVCVANASGRARLVREIAVLKQLGEHPRLASMLYHSEGGDRKQAYLACEAVEPFGFNLDRLVKQYMFAHQSIPSCLAKKLLCNLCEAIDYMHSRSIIHRDIQSSNVLVTSDHEAKLIDMSLACAVGETEKRWIFDKRTHRAPDMCQGGCQLATIDAWGLGVILHQLYQHDCDLVDASGLNVSIRKNRPLTELPMPEHLLAAMLGLLELDTSKRWSTGEAQERGPSDSDLASRHSGKLPWLSPAESQLEVREHLCQFVVSGPPVIAYAAVVDHRNQHLAGRTLGELQLTRFSSTVLLVDVPADPGQERQRALEKSPGMHTVIPANSWLYIGVHQSKRMEDNVACLKEELFPGVKEEIRRNSMSSSGHSCVSTSGLMAFNLEFDCFTFPEHIGKNATIGPRAPAGQLALNLRGSFGLNLAGIVRGIATPEWFPGPQDTVSAGDLGLVVRCPCQDGTSEPTVTDEQLRELIDKELFEARALSRQGCESTSRLSWS